MKLEKIKGKSEIREEDGKNNATILGEIDKLRMIRHKE